MILFFLFSSRGGIDFAYDIVHDSRHDIEGNDDSEAFDSIVALLAFGRTFTTVQRDNDRRLVRLLTRARTHVFMRVMYHV